MSQLASDIPTYGHSRSEDAFAPYRTFNPIADRSVSSTSARSTTIIPNWSPYLSQQHQLNNNITSNTYKNMIPCQDINTILPNHDLFVLIAQQYGSNIFDLPLTRQGMAAQDELRLVSNSLSPASMNNSTQLPSAYHDLMYGSTTKAATQPTTTQTALPQAALAPVVNRISDTIDSEYITINTLLKATRPNNTAISNTLSSASLASSSASLPSPQHHTTTFDTTQSLSIPYGSHNQQNMLNTLHNKSIYRNNNNTNLKTHHYYNNIDNTHIMSCKSSILNDPHLVTSYYYTPETIFDSYLAYVPDLHQEITTATTQLKHRSYTHTQLYNKTTLSQSSHNNINNNDNIFHNKDYMYQMGVIPSGPLQHISQDTNEAWSRIRDIGLSSTMRRHLYCCALFARCLSRPDVTFDIPHIKLDNNLLSLSSILLDQTFSSSKAPTTATYAQASQVWALLHNIFIQTFWPHMGNRPYISDHTPPKFLPCTQYIDPSTGKHIISPYLSYFFTISTKQIKIPVPMTYGQFYARMTCTGSSNDHTLYTYVQDVNKQIKSLFPVHYSPQYRFKPEDFPLLDSDTLSFFYQTRLEQMRVWNYSTTHALRTAVDSLILSPAWLHVTPFTMVALLIIFPKTIERQYNVFQALIRWAIHRVALRYCHHIQTCKYYIAQKEYISSLLSSQEFINEWSRAVDMCYQHLSRITATTPLQSNNNPTHINDIHDKILREHSDKLISIITKRILYFRPTMKSDRNDPYAYPPFSRDTNGQPFYCHACEYYNEINIVSKPWEHISLESNHKQPSSSSPNFFYRLGDTIDTSSSNNTDNIIKLGSLYNAPLSPHFSDMINTPLSKSSSPPAQYDLNTGRIDQSGQGKYLRPRITYELYNHLVQALDRLEPSSSPLSSHYAQTYSKSEKRRYEKGAKSIYPHRDVMHVLHALSQDNGLQPTAATTTTPSTPSQHYGNTTTMNSLLSENPKISSDIISQYKTYESNLTYGLDIPPFMIRMEVGIYLPLLKLELNQHELSLVFTQPSIFTPYEQYFISSQHYVAARDNYEPQYNRSQVAYADSVPIQTRNMCIFDMINPLNAISQLEPESLLPTDAENALDTDSYLFTVKPPIASQRGTYQPLPDIYTDTAISDGVKDGTLNNIIQPLRVSPLSSHIKIDNNNNNNSNATKEIPRQTLLNQIQYMSPSEQSNTLHSYNRHGITSHPDICPSLTPIQRAFMRYYTYTKSQFLSTPGYKHGIRTLKHPDLRVYKPCRRYMLAFALPDPHSVMDSIHPLNEYTTATYLVNEQNMGKISILDNISRFKYNIDDSNTNNCKLLSTSPQSSATTTTTTTTITTDTLTTPILEQNNRQQEQQLQPLYPSYLSPSRYSIETVSPVVHGHLAIETPACLIDFNAVALDIPIERFSILKYIILWNWMIAPVLACVSFFISCIMITLAQKGSISWTPYTMIPWIIFTIVLSLFPFLFCTQHILEHSRNPRIEKVPVGSSFAKINIFEEVVQFGMAGTEISTTDFPWLRPGPTLGYLFLCYACWLGYFHMSGITTFNLLVWFIPAYVAAGFFLISLSCNHFGQSLGLQPIVTLCFISTLLLHLSLAGKNYIAPIILSPFYVVDLACIITAIIFPFCIADDCGVLILVYFFTAVVLGWGAMMTLWLQATLYPGSVTMVPLAAAMIPGWLSLLGILILGLIPQDDTRFGVVNWMRPHLFHAVSRPTIIYPVKKW